MNTLGMLCMYKSIIAICFFSLFILLAGCGKKLPKECQEALDVLEKIDLELDINPYVTDDLKKSFKHTIKISAYGIKRGRINKSCNYLASTYSEQLKSLKNAKSENEVNKRFIWTKEFDNTAIP